MHKGRTLEKEENWSAVGGNVNYRRNSENNVEISQKLKIELLYDPAIPHLGIYLKMQKH